MDCSLGTKKNCDDYFYGVATVGERGQIAIPSEARHELDISPGDKLLVMLHPTKAGLMIAKFEAVDEFIEDLRSKIDEARREAEEEESLL